MISTWTWIISSSCQNEMSKKTKKKIIIIIIRERHDMKNFGISMFSSFQLNLTLNNTHQIKLSNDNGRFLEFFTFWLSDTIMMRCDGWKTFLLIQRPSSTKMNSVAICHKTSCCCVFSLIFVVLLPFVFNVDFFYSEQCVLKKKRDNIVCFHLQFH